MRDAAAYIAIDWKTTSRRAYCMGANGAVLDAMRDDRGGLPVKAGAYPRELAATRALLGS